MSRSLGVTPLGDLGPAWGQHNEAHAIRLHLAIANHVGRAVAGIKPVGKAGVLVGSDEPAHLLQGGGVLLVAKVAPFRQPCLEADPHRPDRLTLGPACYPQPGSQLTGSSHQREPVDGSAYLIARTLRGQLTGKALDLARQVLAVRLHVSG
ncbi:hypothetical protein D3C73_1203020 [compost metagenome]